MKAPGEVRHTTVVYDCQPLIWKLNSYQYYSAWLLTIMIAMLLLHTEILLNNLVAEFISPPKSTLLVLKWVLLSQNV